MKFETLLIHNGYEIDKATGALSIPIYQASTFQQDDVEKGQEFEYSRSGNPTRQALEKTVALLEGGIAAFAFSSGMAATSSAFSIFAPGDHIVICEDVYGGTYRITKSHFSKYGIEFTFVDASKLENIVSAVKENTKGIFIETPSNPLLKITDIKGVADFAKSRGIITLIDSTFMSPYLQRPIELGIDIVIHSATKFIGGHSDVLGGLIVVNSEELAKKIYFVQNGFGAVLGPQDSWLLLRGLKTLKVRMDYQQASAAKVADWLSKNNNVERVYYPGIPGHEGSDIHFRQSRGGGAVLSFEFKEKEKALSFLKKVTLAAVAVSLGGVETILSYPVKMSHAAMPEELRKKLGVSDRLVRVSCGLEDVDDLIEDFENAMK